MNRSILIKQLIRSSLLFTIASIIAINLFFADLPLDYKYLYLLPLTYGILNLVFINTLSDKAISNLPLFLLHGFMFLRMVIAPIFLHFSGLISQFHTGIDRYVSTAILVMIYEMVFVYITSSYFSTRNMEDQKELNITRSTIIRCKSIIIAFVIVLIVCSFLAPNALLLYRSILGYFNYEFTGFDSRNIISAYAASTLTRFAMTTFRYALNICRLIIPCMILMIMKHRKTSAFGVLIAIIFLIFIFEFFIMDDTLAYSILYSLIILIFASKLFMDKRIMLWALVFTLSLVLGFFVSRYILGYGIDRTSGYVEYISRILQSYFSGVTNVAAGFNLPKTDIGYRLKLFIYEILRGVPYASTIFRLDSTSMGKYFNQVNNSVGQIVPTITSCSYYIGKWAAPLFSCILVYLGISAYKRSTTQGNPLKVLSLIIISLYSILGISMYSLEIVSVGIFCFAVPIYLLGCFIDK